MVGLLLLSRHNFRSQTDLINHFAPEYVLFQQEMQILWIWLRVLLSFLDTIVKDFRTDKRVQLIFKPFYDILTVTILV